jgi:hypothetical protein
MTNQVQNQNDQVETISDFVIRISNLTRHSDFGFRVLGYHQ